MECKGMCRQGRDPCEFDCLDSAVSRVTVELRVLAGLILVVWLFSLLVLFFSFVK